MEVISKDILKSIDRKENKKSLSELQILFNQKYDEIQQYKENPSSEEYHKLLDELWKINDQITIYPVG